jgi:hypothetical protein
MELKWEDPSAGREKFDHESIANALKGRPNTWAIVQEYAMTEPYWKATVLGLAIRNGSRAAYEPKGTYEATVRSSDDTVKVYARYVGVSAS